MGVKARGSYETPEGASPTQHLQFGLLRHMNIMHVEDFKFIAGRKVQDSELKTMVADCYRSQGCDEVSVNDMYVEFMRDGRRYIVNCTNFSPKEVFIGVVPLGI